MLFDTAQILCTVIIFPFIYCLNLAWPHKSSFYFSIRIFCVIHFLVHIPSVSILFCAFCARVVCITLVFRMVYYKQLPLSNVSCASLVLCNMYTFFVLRNTLYHLVLLRSSIFMYVPLNSISSICWTPHSRFLMFCANVHTVHLWHLFDIAHQPRYISLLCALFMQLLY